jgi:hypothetical protein
MVILGKIVILSEAKDPQCAQSRAEGASYLYPFASGRPIQAFSRLKWTEQICHPEQKLPSRATLSS